MGILYKTLSPFDKQKIRNTDITKKISPKDSLSTLYNTVPNPSFNFVCFNKINIANAIIANIPTESTL